MKRILTFSLILFASAALLSFAQAKKTPAPKQNDTPCITDCNKEHKRCIDESRKLKKAERRKRIAECNKAEKGCKEKCKKQGQPKNN